MIKINLMGQERPKKARAAIGVPAGAAFFLTVAGVIVAISVAILFFLGLSLKKERDDLTAKVDALKREKVELTGLKQQVETFKAQQAVLEQRIHTIEELQRNKTGGQELLDMLATTVSRTEAMWLTGISRKANSLTIDGTAGSIAAVANYITSLKRSGYFEKVEIKETKQDDENVSVQTFWFTLTADIAQPKTAAAPAAAPATPAGAAAAPKKS